MIYEAYQAHVDVMAPLRLMARTTQGVLTNGWPFPDTMFFRGMAAGCELVARAGISHDRPVFDILHTEIDGRSVAVREVATAVRPFGTLLHFEKDTVVEQPRVLVVAPMSGHFATLLRGTVRTLLPDHDVFITDWTNARNVPRATGRFDFDDFVDYIIDFLHVLGPDTHVIAVCQPAVPVMAAAALMAADKDPARPSSMVLMGGPIDPRCNPTKVNELATTRPLDWFEQNVIGTVPTRYAGACRRVYPGFMQLAGFMTMNLDRHVNAHVDLFNHLVAGDGESAAATKRFYDEYMAVMDLPAEFFLQTIDHVFQRFLLPRGLLESRGRPVDPAAIERTALLTVEGEKDDICAVGQTAAAHDLMPNLPPARKQALLQPGVGHYGVFNGRRWANEIYPVVREFIRVNA